MKKYYPDDMLAMDIRAGSLWMPLYCTRGPASESVDDVVIVHLQAHRQLSSTSSILAATLARRASAALYASRT